MSEIAELGEFGLIEHLTKDIHPAQATTAKGIGDDCAILSPAEGKQTLVTTDLLLEGIHFDLTYTPLKHLGYKAVMVNLSDIYAMNGTPRQITVSLGLSRRFSLEAVETLYDGMRLACKDHQVDIVGGDMTSSLTGLTISITAIGDVEQDRVVTRDGARDTDIICVSGNLGAAYMGLQLLEREKAVFNQQRREAMQQPCPDGQVRQALADSQPDFSGREYLLERQLKPEARRDIIQALAEAGIRPTAMIDISDGLSSELLHICKQSHTGCRIYEDRIPLDYQTAAMAEEMEMNVTTCALNRSEDYELLFTVPLSEHDKVEAIEDVHVIGYITNESLGCQLITRDGQEFGIKAQGWTHLEKNS